MGDIVSFITKRNERNVKMAYEALVHSILDDKKISIKLTGACPFCDEVNMGSKPIMYTEEDGVYQIVCNCAAQGPAGYSLPDAIEAWNESYKED